MNKHIKDLKSSLDKKSDKNLKNWWENYVKDGAPFRGVKMGVIRSLFHKYHKQNIENNMDNNEQIELALALIREDYAEEKLTGILFLDEILIPSGQIHGEYELARFAELFSDGFIYDWNICDWFCVKVLSSLIKRDGKQIAKYISQWREADNLWQARASLVSLVYHANNSSYYPMIKESCNVLIKREERFAKTAVGWIMREVSKYNKELVKKILDKNIIYFSTESLKNATKNFNNQEQLYFIKMFKT